MFWEIFSRLCAEQNIKPNPLAKKIGIPSASITNWKNGRIPHETTLIKIADYFGVSVAYLKGETEEKVPTSQDDFSLTPHEKAIILAYRANPSMQTAVDKLLGLEESSFGGTHSTEELQPEPVSVSLH